VNDVDDTQASEETLQARINTDNPEPRCACVLLLDTSASMAGEPIAELNQGIKAFAEALQDDPLARKRTEVAVISFGGEEPEIQSPFSEMGAFEPIELHAGGRTPMAASILAALDQLQERKRIYQEMGVEFFRPWLIVMTDGAPTDPPAVVDRAFTKLRDWEDKKHVNVFPVGVGANADMAFLARASATREPLRLHQAQLPQFFEWASANLAAVSSSGGHGSSDEEANRRVAAGEQVALTPPPVGWEIA
jgi:uncharacterized protein YegL